MLTILTHAFAFLLGVGGGAYVGYRYGARAVQDVTLATDTIKKL